MADFWVESLPGLDPKATVPSMHAGIINVDDEAGLFFWHIAAKFQVRERPKTVLWLNGGPGCSSMDGALLEMGPFRPQSNDKLEKNPGAWTDYVNMLFLDQPLGVGYSSPDGGRYARNLTQAADHVRIFLEKYLEYFPELALSDVYLAGESFAGQYIPYTWQALQGFQIPLKGIIMANPWIDPAHQYLSYAAFAKKEHLIPESQYPELEKQHERCLNALAAKKTVSPACRECDELYQWIINTYNKAHSSCFNVYKFTEASPYPACGLEWPTNLPAMTSWLNREDVQEALHVENVTTWRECSQIVPSHLHTADTPAGITLVPNMLPETPIMIMVGDLDFICNSDGLETSIENLEWGGEIGWQAEHPMNLTFNNDVVGSVRTARNLTVAHLARGSHMIPVDQQHETRMLLHKFVGVTQSWDPLPDTGTLPSLTTPPQPLHTGDVSKEEINEAMRRAYQQAGITALVVVLVFGLVVLVVWSRSDSGFSFRGFLKALMHTGFPKRRSNSDYIQLQSIRPSTLPEAIPEEEEEDEEEDNFEV